MPSSMPPLVFAVLICLVGAAVHLPLAEGQIAGPGDIFVSMYNNGQQSNDTNITVYDGSTGAFKYNIGNFNAPAGLAYVGGQSTGCVAAKVFAGKVCRLCRASSTHAHLVAWSGLR